MIEERFERIYGTPKNVPRRVALWSKFAEDGAYASCVRQIVKDCRWPAKVIPARADALYAQLSGFLHEHTARPVFPTEAMNKEQIRFIEILLAHGVIPLPPDVIGEPIKET